MVLAAPLTVQFLSASADVGCGHGQSQPTTLSVDGNLYAVVRGADNRAAFGGSGPPVSSFREALALVRKLGFRGTNAQLLSRLSRSAIRGADFAGGSGSTVDSIGPFQPGGANFPSTTRCD
jgi:hypothetical protein